MKDDILVKASKIVNKRMFKYGNPLESWEKVAAIVSLLTNKNITAMDCVLILKIMKLVRESYTHKKDNLMDEAGYIKIQQILIDERNKRNTRRGRKRKTKTKHT